MIKQKPTDGEVHEALFGKRQNALHPQAVPEKRTADGIVFRSKPEKERYLELKTLQQGGKITNLQYEPEFRFVVDSGGLRMLCEKLLELWDADSRDPGIDDVLQQIRAALKQADGENFVCTYKPDFTYVVRETQEFVAEDCKGFKKGKSGKMLPRLNRESHIKFRLMKILFGLEVRIV